MLKKLFKHEWMETWKISTLLLAVMFGLTAVSQLYFHFAPSLAPDVEIHVGNMLLFIGYAFLIAACSLLMVLYFGIRFYKNLFTDEGYLMHTLPVAPWMLVASKAGIATLWTWLIHMITVIAILPVTKTALPKLAYIEPYEWEQIPSLFMVFGIFDPKAVLLMVLSLLVSNLSGLLLIYAAVSLGQLFSKHKAFSSIVCYLGLSALVSAVSSICMLPGLTGLILTHADDSESFLEVVMPGIMQNFYIASTLANLLLCVVLFFGSCYLIKKNLNLD